MSGEGEEIIGSAPVGDVENADEKSVHVDEKITGRRIGRDLARRRADKDPVDEGDSDVPDEEPS